MFESTRAPASNQSQPAAPRCRILLRAMRSQMTALMRGHDAHEGQGCWCSLCTTADGFLEALQTHFTDFGEMSRAAIPAMHVLTVLQELHGSSYVPSSPARYTLPNVVDHGPLTVSPAVTKIVILARMLAEHIGLIGEDEIRWQKLWCISTLVEAVSRDFEYEANMSETVIAHSVLHVGEALDRLEMVPDEPTLVLEGGAR